MYKRQVRAVAARLSELGYTVASVPDAEDQLPTAMQTALVNHDVRLNSNRPLPVRHVARSAEQAGMSLPEAIAHYAAWGYRCSVTAEGASRAGRIDNRLLTYGPFHDPGTFGPVTPAVLRAVGARNADSLADFGYDVVPPSEAWTREGQLERTLLRALTTDAEPLPVDAPPEDPPLSLVTLAVVALSAAKTLRETALKATELGMRHEIEDWFPDPEIPSPQPPTPS